MESASTDAAIVFHLSRLFYSFINPIIEVFFSPQGSAPSSPKAPLPADSQPTRSRQPLHRKSFIHSHTLAERIAGRAPLFAGVKATVLRGTGHRHLPKSSVLSSPTRSSRCISVIRITQPMIVTKFSTFATQLIWRVTHSHSSSLSRCATRRPRINNIYDCRSSTAIQPPYVR